MIMRRPQTVVGERAIQNFDFLRSLCRTKSCKKSNRLIANASDEQLLTIVEIALNILKTRFPLKETQRRKLVPLADLVRKLSRSRSARNARLIVQKGGNPLLSALLLPVAIEVGRYLLENKTDGSQDGASS